MTLVQDRPVPLYYFACTDCEEVVRKILSVKSTKSGFLHLDCGGILLRAPRGATSRKIERLDNGIMVRAIERDTESERMYKERSEEDLKQRLEDRKGI